MFNGSTAESAGFDLLTSATTIPLIVWTSATAVAALTGAGQNNTSRTISLSFQYEV